MKKGLIYRTTRDANSIKQLITSEDKEIAAIKEIVAQTELIDGEAKVRLFKYLKSRYGKYWPID